MASMVSVYKKRVLLSILGVMFPVSYFLLQTFTDSFFAGKAIKQHSNSRRLGHSDPSEDTLLPFAKFDQRRQHYIEACARTAASPYFRRSHLNKASFLQVDNLAFCPIAKTGTTLWKNIMYYIVTNKTTPFHQAIVEHVHTKTQKLRTRADRLTGNGVKTLVFVREPYARLLSAYVNKMFNVDPRNWRSFGNPVARYTRLVTKNDTVDACHSSRITFPEFIRYFIDSETRLAPHIRRNPHYVPQSQLCSFCLGVKEVDMASHRNFKMVKSNSGSRENDQYPSDSNCSKGEGRCTADWKSGFVFDLIGKSEEISDDTRAIFQYMNMTHKLPRGLDMNFSVKRRTISIRSQRLFNSFSNPAFTSCMSKEEALRRMWKNNQIRGYLSLHELFPLSPISAQKVKSYDFENMILSAFDRSQRDPDIKMSRKLVMEEAYSMITLKDRKTLRKIFRRDFELFDYPATIPEVFPQNDEFPIQKNKFFDIFDKNID